METKEIIRNLREDNNLTQEQMADKLGTTRQAVSRIQHMPNPENQSDSARRAMYDGHLSQLKHWKR